MEISFCVLKTKFLNKKQNKTKFGYENVFNDLADNFEYITFLFLPNHPSENNMCKKENTQDFRRKVCFKYGLDNSLSLVFVLLLITKFKIDYIRKGKYLGKESVKSCLKHD